MFFVVSYFQFRNICGSTEIQIMIFQSGKSYSRRVFHRNSSSKTAFFKTYYFWNVFLHFSLIKRPWNDHKILMWLKVTLSDVIVQFCHSFCHSWREIWIFISDILHVTEWINWKIISTKNGWSISGGDQLTKVVYKS